MPLAAATIASLPNHRRPNICLHNLISLILKLTSPNSLITCSPVAAAYHINEKNERKRERDFERRARHVGDRPHELIVAAKQVDEQPDSPRRRRERRLLKRVVRRREVRAHFKLLRLLLFLVKRLVSARGRHCLTRFSWRYERAS